MEWPRVAARLFSLLAVAALLAAMPAQARHVELLNVSYDATRELYEDYNAAFVAYWKQKTGDDLVVKQSHGGSAKQAQAVIDGLGADVVTLGLAPDIDAIVRQSHLIAPGWQARFPNDSVPYTSTIVFLVRKGNPKAIRDWPDLVRPDVEVVTPNPKTSGGARWNYLAAYGYALNTQNFDDGRARAFVQELYAHVRVLDTGARGSTITFVEHEQGDVLLAWENEALLIAKQLEPNNYDIVYPSQSIVAEPPVAVVDANVDKHGTHDVAKEYLQYLYSPAGQEIVARNYCRPRDPIVAGKAAATFAPLQLFTLKDEFGAWSQVQKLHFADGGVFDQIYGKK